MTVQKLGKYELIEELGRGGYGTVYLARETVLDVERAVKVLHPALIADPEFIERFRREAKFAARIEHPHIVPVYELDEAEGSYFLVMKYMPGGTLKEYIANEGKLYFEHALEITRQIAEALDFAHSRPEQLIHRDVKPGNILFEADGNARLSDFGFAKALSGTRSASLSASGGMIGTPPYMAPEIWRGKEVTPATDVYSLACMLFEMITGEVLFDGESPPEIMTRHVLDGPQLPERWAQGVPPGMDAVLREALARDIKERISNPGKFYHVLSKLSMADQEQARLDAEEKANREAAAQVQRDAEKAKKREAEVQALREAEQAKKREVEESANGEAEEKVRREREVQERARKQAEKQAQKEAEISVIKKTASPVGLQTSHRIQAWLNNFIDLDWMAVGILAFGWGISWMLFVFLRAYFENIFSEIVGYRLDDVLGNLIGWSISGLLIGAILSISLRSALKDFDWISITIMIIGWTFCWPISTLISYFIEQIFNVHEYAISWGVGGIFVGLLAMLSILRVTKGYDSVAFLSQALGWGIGWGLSTIPENWAYGWVIGGIFMGIGSGIAFQRSLIDFKWKSTVIISIGWAIGWGSLWTLMLYIHPFIGGVIGGVILGIVTQLAFRKDVLF